MSKGNNGGLHNSAILNALNGIVENTPNGHAAHCIVDGRMIIGVCHRRGMLFDWFLDGVPVERPTLIKTFDIQRRECGAA